MPTSPSFPPPSFGAARVEHDLLGNLTVPAVAYYGVQTVRALDNFQITGIPLSHFPQFVRALTMVKKAAARVNRKLGLLPEKLEAAICAACDEVIAGQRHDQFVVDMIQSGAGTSTNMNANEVIANPPVELMAFEKGARCIKGITANEDLLFG